MWCRVLLLLVFFNLPSVAQRTDYDVEFGKTDTLSIIRRYLTCVEISHSPYFSNMPNGKQGRYRLTIRLEEIYYYPTAEFLTYSGTENHHVALEYSVPLKRKMFTGQHQPGNEGVDVTIGKWSSQTECYLGVNNETYLVKFDPDSDKIKVELVVKKEKDK